MPSRNKRSFLFPVLLFGLLLGTVARLSAATSNDYYQIGMKDYNAGQYREAIRYLQAATQLDPSNWQAYQAEGNCYYALRDYPAAQEAYDQSLAVHPDNPGLRNFSRSLQKTTGRGSSQESAGSNSPITGSGNFGLGLDFGGPGSWGATGKFWMDGRNAFQGMFKLGGGGTILQLDYLWHDFDLIHAGQGALPFYIGVGGDLALGGDQAAVGGRLPIGLSYLFQKKTVPVDIFVEVAPTLWFYTAGIHFDIYGDLGARFYF
ncbi:MAG TPA: tetratricopeptide repeat protein [bacterium]|nr:tetratricopeptide repeat protein [bacterium]